MSSSAEGRDALHELWSFYRLILARRGVDISPGLARWAEQKRSHLERFDAQKSFDTLCAHGCQKIPLAILIAVIKPLQSFGNKWRGISGTPRQRRQTIRSIEKAANALETMLDAIDAVVTRDFPTDPIEGDRLENNWRMFTLLSDNRSGDAGTPAVPELSVAIEGLKLYASALRTFDLSRKDTGMSSTDMLAKYLFSAYVIRATTHFHDAEVSTLIGATLDIFYDESAHKTWRNRNYKRIDKNFSNTVDLLTDVGSALGT